MEEEKLDRLFCCGSYGADCEQEENGVRNSFPCFVAVFGGRDVKTSRLDFLELCELKNNSYTGTKGKATRLLRLTRLHADSHSAGSRDQDINHHQHEPEDGG